MPVSVQSRLRRVRLLQPQIGTLVQRILEAAGEPKAEVGLEFVGDRRIRRLNQQYRRQDRPTDVLAFPMREAGGPYTPLLGDVVVSLHTAARQAAADERSVDDEVVTLLIHGILHLCGYDHERGGREARRMRRKERTILRSLGATPRLIVQRSTVGA